MVSQSESDDSWADNGMVAVDPSKVKVKAYQKRACSKAPATSTPNAEDHKMARGHQFTNNQSSVKDAVNTPKMEVKADMKSINSKAPAASTPVKLHSEMADNESKYKQRLPKKMESCLKDLERQVEADLRAKAMEKAIESSKVETSDHCLQNESSEFSKERGVSSFKTPNKLMFPTSRKPVEDEWNSTKCVIKLTKSPWRSISNQNIGDPNRRQLGDNGSFVVQANLTSGLRRVVYFDSKDIEKFVADVPPKNKIHKAIFGNAGREPCFAWDACNLAHRAGGTTIAGAEGSTAVVAFRRFHFAFTSNAMLSVALYHMFYESQELVEEFFKEKGKMYASEANVPAHKIVKAESDMDIDHKVRRAPCTPQQMKAKLGYDPKAASQAY